MSALALVPGLPLREANAFVALHHRHHPAVVGCYFCIGGATLGLVVAVAIVGRPKARELQDGFTAEVTRLCVDPEIEAAAEMGHAGAEYMKARAAGLRGLAHAERVAQRSATGWCSTLYASAWRAWRALGGQRLVTYTLLEEGGGSLRGAGWRCVGVAGGGSWSRASRPRVDMHPTQEKLRWEATAS